MGIGGIRLMKIMTLYQTVVAMQNLIGSIEDGDIILNEQEIDTLKNAQEYLCRLEALNK
jgi:hypothetical protein